MLVTNLSSLISILINVKLYSFAITKSYKISHGIIFVYFVPSIVAPILKPASPKTKPMIGEFASVVLALKLSPDRLYAYSMSPPADHPLEFLNSFNAFSVMKNRT